MCRRGQNVCEALDHCLFARVTDNLKNDDAVDRNELVLRNRRLIGRICNAYRGRYAAGLPFEWDDVEQEALLGLVRASRTYRPADGRFSTYAIPFIKGRVARCFRRRVREESRPDLDRLAAKPRGESRVGVTVVWGRVTHLEPVFPAGPFTPSSPCADHAGIDRGSAECCMVCHQSGLDGHPDLERPVRTGERGRPKKAVVIEIIKRPTESLAARRARMYPPQRA